RKDDLILMATPFERAKNDVSFAELLEEIKSQRDILRRVEHRIAERDVDESLAEVRYGNRGLGIIGPRRRIGIGELCFALIEIQIHALPQKSKDGRHRRFELGAREPAVSIRIERCDPLQREQVVSEFAYD